VILFARAMDDVLEISAVPAEQQYLMWCQTGTGSIFFNTDNPGRTQTWQGTFSSHTLGVRRRHAV
jgi:hypothetical protein